MRARTSRQETHRWSDRFHGDSDRSCRVRGWPRTVRGVTDDAQQLAAADQEVEEELERVTTLELFLDLVFVLTVTQLTSAITGTPTGRDYVQAGLVLVVTWWMYDGFVWLTGNVVLDRPWRRLVLFAG